MLRVLPTYTEKELSLTECKRNVLLSQFALLEKKETTKTYDNQKDAANLLIQEISDLKNVFFLVLGNTQSGKTGVMSAFLRSYYEHETLQQTPVENVFVITAMSSTMWKAQTQNRLPGILRDQVYHLPDLKKKLVPQLIGKKDVLLLIDETQIGAKKGQTIHQTIKMLGYDNIDTVLNNNIRILMFTATPSGVNMTMHHWEPHITRVSVNEGDTYYSAQRLLEMGKVLQYQNICGINSKGEETIDTAQLNVNLTEMRDVMLSFTTPRYHIIRTQRGIMGLRTEQNVKRMLPSGTKFVKFDMKTKKTTGDINQILKKQPDQHTVIFIKDSMRCAKTIYKKWVGIMYERHTHIINDEVIIQGIRLTGYDYNGDAIMFTNIHSIRKYQTLLNTKFKDAQIEWISNTTRFSKRNQVTYPIETFLTKEKPVEKQQTVEKCAE